MIRIDSSDLFERCGVFGRAVRDVEQVVARIHLGLDLDYLPVAGNPVRIYLDERITLAKDLNERVDLLRLERTIERDFTYCLSSFY